MKTKNFGKDMIRPTGNLGSVKSLKNCPRKPNPVENSPTETQSSNVLRYVRRPRPNSATTQRCSGLEYSYNVHQGALGRRFSLIPSFPDTEWELQSCLQCSEQTDTADQKHDGMSGEHLRPLLSLWKFAGEPPKNKVEKGSVRHSIQRQCGCVVRTSRKTDLT